MGNLIAPYVGDWEMLGLDCSVEFQTVTRGDSVTIQKRDHYTVMMRRQVLGGVTFWESAGETNSAAFSAHSSPTIEQNFAFPGRKYKCSHDELRIENHITGEVYQYQTWEHYSVWEDCADDEFI